MSDLWDTSTIRCKVCGAKLTSEASRRRQCGPSCYMAAMEGFVPNKIKETAMTSYRLVRITRLNELQEKAKKAV